VADLDVVSELETRILEALDLVATALECAVEAIQRQDAELARMVVGDDDYTDARHVDVHAGVVSLLGRGLGEAELRTAVGLLRVSRHVERIGDHCVNLAKLVLLDARTRPADPVTLNKIGRMGRLAHQHLGQAKTAFAERDVAVAEDLVNRDEALNRLNRECFRRALHIGDDADRREWAMHMMLAARWLERIGDNAVDIGETAAFVATGAVREFTDASHSLVSG
jgi:phosphate transport system protein